jgi:pimeloyl-ACP methyl ester carboxylesterase
LARAADDVRAVLEQHNIARATLIGHSMGGLIAQEFGARYPDRTRALVLIDTLCLTTRLGFGGRLGCILVAVIVRVLPFKLLVARLGRKISTQPHVQRYAVGAAGQMSRQALISVWSGIAKSLATARNEISRIPMLLLVGRDDRFGQVFARYRVWAERATGGDFTLIPQAGHVPHQDNPNLVNDAIMTFLRKLPAYAL